MPDVFQLVDAVHRQSRRLQRRLFRETGLRPPQYFVLNELWSEDRRALNDLAEACRCSPSTMTWIVDILERKALVTRERHPSDRRSILVRLTPEGKALRSSASTAASMMKDCCVGVTSADLNQLSDLLRKFRNALESNEAQT